MPWRGVGRLIPHPSGHLRETRASASGNTRGKTCDRSSVTTGCDLETVQPRGVSNLNNLGSGHQLTV